MAAVTVWVISESKKLKSVTPSTFLPFYFPNFELVLCPMSGSICFFLIWIQISRETDKVVWYSHLLMNFPQFVVIHTVKGFSVVNEVEVDVFLEFPYV